MYINCEYCGTQFNSKLGKCPNCGAEVASNAELHEQKAMDKKIAEEIKQVYDAVAKSKVEARYKAQSSSRWSKFIIVWLVIIIIILLLNMITIGKFIPSISSLVSDLTF